MKVIIQLQYSLTDSRVFHDVENITQSSLHPTQPNPWMDPTHDQLCGTVEMRKCDHVTPSGGTLCVLVSFHRCDRCQCFPAVRCDCPRIIEIELIQQQGHGRILHRIGVVARDPQIEIQVVDRRG